MQDTQAARMRAAFYAPAEYVNSCGHAQEFVPLPEAEGWCRLVPVIGETT